MNQGKTKKKKKKKLKRTKKRKVLFMYKVFLQPK